MTSPFTTNGWIVFTQISGIRFGKKLRNESKGTLITRQFKTILEGMMNKSPAKRLSVEELILHDFFIEPCIDVNILKEKNN